MFPSMNKEKAPDQWADLAMSLYDKLTGRNAEIASEFDELEIGVTSHVGADAVHTPWKLTGTVKIRTKDL